MSNNSSNYNKKKKKSAQNNRQRVHWVDALKAYQQQEVEKPAMWAAMQGAATTAQQELADPAKTLTYLDEHTRQVLYGAEHPAGGSVGGDDKATSRGLAQILPLLLLMLTSAVYTYQRAYQKIARVM